MKTITLGIALILFAVCIVQPAVSVENGLVAYWAFNEDSGEIASDSSGNGFDGELLGDPAWTKDGYFDGALEFDQDGDEVSIAFNADLNQDTFTVCAWANVDPDSANHRAVISSRHEPPLSGYIIYAEPGNKWQFWIGTGSPPWSVVQGPAINLGEWEHLAAICAGGKQMFYVNGELVGEQDGAVNVNTQQELLIGAGANERANHNYRFKGKIDEVRIYDRQLSGDEIMAVMETSFAPVEATGKLALTWGQLKQ